MTHIFQLKPEWKEFKHPGIPPNCKGYVWGNCRVFVGQESTGWHLSISCANRNPTWEEIKAARYMLLPNDVTVAMILPPTEEYVNIHNFCFHLHQIPNEVVK